MRRLDPPGPFVGRWTDERVRRMKDNVEMTDLSGDNRIANPPQLPKYSVYKGETSRNKREFFGKYEKYYITLLDYETYNNKPFVMPVYACVAAWKREQTLKLELCKSPSEVTKQDWIGYFREAIVTDSLDLGKIENMMKKFE